MQLTAFLRQPLDLTSDVLQLLARRMPDMIIYQHAEEEWWVAPLDDQLPLLRLNRIGAELLAAMDGQGSVGTLLKKFGHLVCGPDGETGQWHLERWSLPNYSLCFYGNTSPTQERQSLRWDLLLQQIREGWSGQKGFEGADHLPEFHLQDIKKQEGHFDTIETTVSPS